MKLDLFSVLHYMDGRSNLFSAVVSGDCFASFVVIALEERTTVKVHWRSWSWSCRELEPELVEELELDQYNSWKIDFLDLFSFLH